jgi:hypothetical protein
VISILSGSKCNNHPPASAGIKANIGVMKKFGAAAFLFATTVLMLWGEGITYQRIADLYDHGRIGELSILADL